MVCFCFIHATLQPETFHALGAFAYTIAGMRSTCNVTDLRLSRARRMKFARNQVSAAKIRALPLSQCSIGT